MKIKDDFFRSILLGLSIIVHIFLYEVVLAESLIFENVWTKFFTICLILYTIIYLYFEHLHFFLNVLQEVDLVLYIHNLHRI